MTDAPRKTGVQTAAAPHNRQNASLPAIGPIIISTDQGPLDLNEVPGLTTCMVTNPVGVQTIAIVSYDIPANTGETLGRGLFVQLTPDVARHVGASLLQMADDLDPKGRH